MERYNATINKLLDHVTWWMSLNKTAKTSRDLTEKLVQEAEKIITQELIMWSGLSIVKQNNTLGDKGRKIDDT